MRSADITGHPDTDPTVHLTGHPPAASTWSDADLVALTLRFANDPTPATAGSLAAASHAPATAGPLAAPVRDPATAGPLTGRVTDRAEGIPRSSTAPTTASTPVPISALDPNEPAWSIPLLATPEVEAWLLGWPTGLVTAAHGHGRAAVAVTVVEGGLSEECLDPTIWTTSRRTTWRAGVSTLFPAGHVHVLGATGDRPAVTVHAWSRPAGSAGGGAGRLALGVAAAAGRGPGGGRGRAEPVGVGPGRGRHHCLGGHPAHGALDLGHVRDRVAG
jgi:Cysteine dioxygenase type I